MHNPPEILIPKMNTHSDVFILRAEDLITGTALWVGDHLNWL